MHKRNSDVTKNQPTIHEHDLDIAAHSASPWEPSLFTMVMVTIGLFIVLVVFFSFVGVK